LYIPLDMIANVLLPCSHDIPSSFSYLDNYKKKSRMRLFWHGLC